MVLLLEALVAAGVVFLFYVFMAILTEKVYAACKKAEKEAYLTEEAKETDLPEKEEKEEKDGEEPEKNRRKSPVNRKNRRIGKQTRPPTDRKKGVQSGFLTF